MRILLDFDGTLCPDHCGGAPETPPDPAAAALVRNLRAAGHTIVILSCRAHGSSPEGWRARAAAREIAAYLRLHEIPFDEILTAQPHGDALIDERAVPFQGNWPALAEALRHGMRIPVPRP